MRGGGRATYYRGLLIYEEEHKLFTSEPSNPKLFGDFRLLLCGIDVTKIKDYSRHEFLRVQKPAADSITRLEISVRRRTTTKTVRITSADTGRPKHPERCQLVKHPALRWIISIHCKRWRTKQVVTPAWYQSHLEIARELGIQVATIGIFEIRILIEKIPFCVSLAE